MNLETYQVSHAQASSWLHHHLKRPAPPHTHQVNSGKCGSFHPIVYPLHPQMDAVHSPQDLRSTEFLPGKPYPYRVTSSPHSLQDRHMFSGRFRGLRKTPTSHNHKSCMCCQVHPCKQHRVVHSAAFLSDK